MVRPGTLRQRHHCAAALASKQLAAKIHTAKNLPFCVNTRLVP
jgi:hypothetical protein